MNEQEGARRAPASSAVLTVPNAISALRVLLIPVFVALILDHDTSAAGLVLFGFVSATDWVDGVVARRTGQISELGKLLDPTADRLAIAAGLIALTARHVFPLWAALVILVRDGLILLAGLALLVSRRARVDVRYVGKAATFSLMVSVAWIAWGNLGLPLRHAFLAAGWVLFSAAIIEYGVATVIYAGELRSTLALSPRGPS